MRISNGVGRLFAMLSVPSPHTHDLSAVLATAIFWTGAIGCSSKAPEGKRRDQDSTQWASGHWSGAISFPETSLAVELDLGLSADGAWYGEADVPDQGATDVPVGVAVTAGGVRVWLESEGNPQVEASRVERILERTSRPAPRDPVERLEGWFSQHGERYAFTAKRTGDPVFGNLLMSRALELERLPDVHPLDADGAALRAAVNADSAFTRLVLLLAPS